MLRSNIALTTITVRAPLSWVSSQARTTARANGTYPGSPTLRYCAFRANDRRAANAATLRGAQDCSGELFFFTVWTCVCPCDGCFPDRDAAHGGVALIGAPPRLPPLTPLDLTQLAAANDS